MRVMGNTGNAAWEAYWADKANHEWWELPAPEVVDFIASQPADRMPRVLDLGCGLGRHAIASALAGHRVTATDASTEAITHLNEWAARLGLSVETRICDVLAGGFAGGSFDIVLSYNVIYHGLRQQFARAIEHISFLLKPGGLLFFTCPTRRDGKYGFGKEVAPHTFLCEKSITPGDIHYFADEADLDELLAGFRIVSRSASEGHFENRGIQQFYSNWIVVAEKPL